MAPQIPRPPCQILNASTGCPPAPKYGCQLVMTWYSRPPTIPNGTAYAAMSRDLDAGVPRASRRRPVSQTAMTMPARMHRAYPRTTRGPTWNAPTVGLGIETGSSAAYVVS